MCDGQFAIRLGLVNLTIRLAIGQLDIEQLAIVRAVHTELLLRTHTLNSTGRVQPDTLQQGL